jgi:hypothetical protein
LGQAVNHVLAVEPSFDVDGQTFSAVFVDQGQHPERTSIAGLIVYKVITPHMIASLGSKPDATSVVQPQSSAFPPRQPEVSK